MADLLFVAVIIAFFAVCLLLVKACDRIIGPDDGQLDEDTTTPREEVAPMSVDNVIGLVLALLIAGYLVVALVFPEKL